MDALMQLPITMNFTKATLSITSGAASTFITANTSATAINYALKGKFFAKAVGTGIATPTTDATTGLAFPALAASQGTVVVIGLDSAGSYKASQGAIQALDANGNFIVSPQFPAVPDTVCPIGYFILKNGSTGSAFTFGTGLWNATGMSGNVVVIDIACLPDRPQVA